MDISSLREREQLEPFSVSELNVYIKNLFEGDRTLSSVTVRGEISNFVNHRSGHLYFSLKDADGQIRAVMFRSHAARLRFIPESGMKVTVHGAVTVYPRDGSYQIYVSSMQPDGIGALYLAYEQLKSRLSAEGLFDDEHKKEIPPFPTRVGVVTSPTGAAVRDIINVIGRRFPLASVYLYPSLVQGEGAEDDLVRAIDYFDRSRLCDVVIIGRGGGSIEDLWAFNSEKLARRIFAADVPVISAVGHETDFTICDFVSDLRAPTPSAAAELAVPDIRELMLLIDSLSERSANALIRASERARERLDRLCAGVSAEEFSKALADRRDAVGSLYEDALACLTKKKEELCHSLAINAEKLSVLNPLAVLTRGYATASKNGSLISSIEQVSVGDELSVRVSDGVIKTNVVGKEEVDLNERKGK